MILYYKYRLLLYFGGYGMIKLNNKGFTLFELLGCLIILGIIFGIGLYSARGTLATADTMMNKISENEIYETVKLYIVEYPQSWYDGYEEYACVSVDELVDYGYFDRNEVIDYFGKDIRIVRDNSTKVINKIEFVDVCE